MRETYGHGVQEVTLGRDGMEYAAVKGADGESRMRERKVEFEGTTAIYPIKTREGPMRYSRIDLEPVDLTELGPYEGYLCK